MSYGCMIAKALEPIQEGPVYVVCYDGLWYAFRARSEFRKAEEYMLLVKTWLRKCELDEKKSGREA